MAPPNRLFTSSPPPAGLQVGQGWGDLLLQIFCSTVCIGDTFLRWMVTTALDDYRPMVDDIVPLAGPVWLSSKSLDSIRNSFNVYKNAPLWRISHTALLCLHSNASSGTLLDILHTYAIFVYFALVPSHALGASTSRAASLFRLGHFFHILSVSICPIFLVAIYAHWTHVSHLSLGPAWPGFLIECEVRQRI